MEEVMNLAEIKPFDYSVVDQETASFLQAKVEKIKVVAGQALTDIGRELRDAQDRLSKRGYGCFEAWYISLGYKKDNVYNLINRYNLLVGNPDKQSLIEALPKSVAAEIAKPSAPAAAVQQVLAGDITTHKEYQDLLAKLKASEAKAEKATKERDALKDKQMDIDSYQKQIGGLNTQIGDLKRQLKDKPIETTATKTVEVIPEETQRELEDLRKKASMAGSSSTQIFKVYFDEMVDTFKKLLSVLSDIQTDDPTTYAKYRKAAAGLIGKLGEQVQDEATAEAPVSQTCNGDCGTCKHADMDQVPDEQLDEDKTYCTLTDEVVDFNHSCDRFEHHDQ